MRIIILASLLLLSSFGFATAPKMPVSGFARSFPFSSAIADAKIKILETGETYHTDANGNFGPIYYPVNKPITLVLKKFGYKTTQSATIIVPPEGLSGSHEVTFQVPPILTYYLLSALMGATIDRDSCHLVATITGFHKTLNDDEQGEAGSIAVLSPHVATQPFYFDIFTHGPLKDKTDPFTKGLTRLTADGGVAYFNLPPSKVPYTLSAIKQGVVFNSAKFLCRRGVFINISPPQGPTVT